MLQESQIVLKESWKSLISCFIQNLDRKNTTKETYRKALKEWVIFFNAQEKNPDINLILQYKSYLIERNLSAYSVSLYLSALKVFLDYLVERRIIPFNPAKSIRGVKKPKGRRDSLTKEEALKLISFNSLITLEDYRNKAILLLKLFTGLRDVSIVNISIDDLKVKEGKHLLYYQSKGRDLKDEFVVLEGNVYDAINDYLIKRKDFNASEPLFVSHSDRNMGQRLTTQSIRLITRTLFKKAGIVRPEIKPHSLRHSAITFAMLGGANITQARDMASHRSIETTAGYFHDFERLKDPAEFYINKYLCINVKSD